MDQCDLRKPPCACERPRRRQLDGCRLPGARKCHAKRRNPHHARMGHVLNRFKFIMQGAPIFAGAPWNTICSQSFFTFGKIHPCKAAKALQENSQSPAPPRLLLRDRIHVVQARCTKHKIGWTAHRNERHGSKSLGIGRVFLKTYDCCIPYNIVLKALLCKKTSVCLPSFSSN